MCFNRVEYAESLCIGQPFSPCLLQQGDLPGPNLFLKFWRQQLNSDECWQKWQEDSKQKRSNSVVWPKKMPLFCRGCSDAVDKDTRKPLEDFPHQNSSDVFNTLIAQGMERFCNACRRSGRLRNLPDGITDDNTANIETVSDDVGDNRLLQCTKCKVYKSKVSFDADKLRMWQQNRHIDQAKCLVCEKQNAIQKDIFCVHCKIVKSPNDYDSIMVERWRKNRDLTKRAQCKACAATRNTKTHAPKRHWLQREYKCKKCKKRYAPSHFDYTKLEELEQNKQIFDAECLNCNPAMIDALPWTLAPVQCISCKEFKNKQDFSLQRQRNRTLASR